jgi:xylulokinase
MTLALGVDIGTFESKGVIADETGRIMASAARPHKMLVPQPGWAEHDPLKDWWGDFCFLSRRLLADSGVAPKDVKAVAVSAIGPCMLPIGKAGEPLMNGVLYGVDTRAAAEIEEMTAVAGEERLLDACGNALSSQSVGPKILWLKRHRPQIFAAADRIVGATSFIVRRLTGETTIDHYTAASMGPLYDIAKQTWTDALASGLIALNRLPELKWSSEIVGSVTTEAEAETGLAMGTPVTCGTIDAAAEAASVVVRAPGDVMMMYGSTMFLIALTPERTRDARLWSAPWLLPGVHASMAGLATSGTLTHWFRDQFARDLSPGDAWKALAAEAEASPPGAKGLIVLPYFSGERTPIHDPHAKGVIFGLDLTHTRGDVYRATLEGIALGVRHVMDAYAEAGVRPLEVAAVGGGVANAVWSSAISDASGLSQVIRSKTMGAAYGDAFLAMTAIGAAKSEDIEQWNPPQRRIAPHRANAQTYDRRYDAFRGLYDVTKHLMRRPA